MGRLWFTFFFSKAMGCLRHKWKLKYNKWRAKRTQIALCLYKKSKKSENSSEKNRERRIYLYLWTEKNYCPNIIGSDRKETLPCGVRLHLGARWWPWQDTIKWIGVPLFSHKKNQGAGRNRRQCRVCQAVWSGIQHPSDKLMHVNNSSKDWSRIRDRRRRQAIKKWFFISETKQRTYLRS